MTAASANKVTVPGDNRLDELKLGNKTPFWHKIPIIKELRVAVGWQKGMLITGLVLTAFFLLVAIFAPLIAPYSYAQLKGADGVSFPAQAAPSSEHIWGTTAGGYDVFSRVVWGARTAVIAIVVAVLLSIFAGVLLGLVSGYFGGWVDRVLVMIADAVYSFPSLLLAILMAIMISHGQSGLWSGIFASGISITVVYIPQYFRTIRADVIRIRGIRPRGRRLHVAHHDQAPVQELHTNPAGHPDAELLRSHPDPCGPGLPGLRHRTDRGRRMGIRPQPRRLRCDRRHLVDRRVPRSGHRAHRAGHHPGGRIAERSGRSASAQAKWWVPSRTRPWTPARSQASATRSSPNLRRRRIRWEPATNR